MPGGGHPGIDDRLRGRQPERAPGDVLADRKAVLRARDVAARADPVERGLAAGGDVGEVVAFGHVAAVAFGGAGQFGVGRERALAVAFAFLIDQAEDRRADLGEVARLRGEARVGAGAGVGGGGQCAERRGRPETGGECEQRCESGVCHGGCIDSRAREPEPGRAGLDNFGPPRAKSGRYCPMRVVANHPSADARKG